MNNSETQKELLKIIRRDIVSATEELNEILKKKQDVSDYINNSISGIKQKEDFLISWDLKLAEKDKELLDRESKLNDREKSLDYRDNSIATREGDYYNEVNSYDNKLRRVKSDTISAENNLEGIVYIINNLQDKIEPLTLIKNNLESIIPSIIQKAKDEVSEIRKGFLEEK